MPASTPEPAANLPDLVTPAAAGAAEGATAGAAAQFSRWLAVAALLGLVLLSLAWELWLAPLRPGGSWLVLKALPLCIPLAGLLKRRMYTYRWLSLLVWLYFIEGVVRAWGDAPPSRWCALAEIALCLLLFAACVLHIRGRQRAASPATQRAAAS